MPKYEVKHGPTTNEVEPHSYLIDTESGVVIFEDGCLDLWGCPEDLILCRELRVFVDLLNQQAEEIAELKNTSHLILRE